MYAHIQLGARDLPAMVAFYDAVLGHFGLLRANSMQTAGPAGVIWQRPGQRWPQFVVARPFNGVPATWGNGCQVSFLAPAAKTVEQAWRAALQAGGTDEGAPGPRPRYAADFYAAYCRDPEGNKLAFVYAPGGGPASA